MGVQSSKNIYKFRHDETANQCDKITQSDLDLVKASWHMIESKEEFGVQIMITLFLDHSHLKSKWIFASNLETEEEMLDNSQLKYHAKNIVNILDQVVEKVISSPSADNINIDQCGLVVLGTKHFHFDVSRPDFAHFKSAFYSVLKKNLKKKMKCGSKLKNSWFKVLDLVIDQMATGIEQEAVDEKKRQENSKRPYSVSH